MCDDPDAAALRFAGVRRVILATTPAPVASRYFAFPHLRAEGFQRGNDVFAIGGIDGERILHLCATGVA